MVSVIRGGRRVSQLLEIRRSIDRMGHLGAVAVLAILALTIRGFGQGLYVTLSVLFFPVNVVVSLFLLGILFFLVITPIGIVLRLMGRDALSLKMSESAKSYWTACRESTPTESYFRRY